MSRKPFVVATGISPNAESRSERDGSEAAEAHLGNGETEVRTRLNADGSTAVVIFRSGKLLLAIDVPSETDPDPLRAKVRAVPAWYEFEALPA